MNKNNSDYTDEERKALAKKSLEFVCPVCGLTRNLLLEDSGENEEKDEIAEFAAQLTVSKPKEPKDNKESEKNEETSNIENLGKRKNINVSPMFKFFVRVRNNVNVFFKCILLQYQIFV